MLPGDLRRPAGAGEETRRELADQALLNARAIKSVEDRFTTYARVADKLIDLGEKDRARKLLAEAEELARPTRKGNYGGFNLGLVAQALARLDLPAGLKMVEDLEAEVRKNDKADRTYVFVKIYGGIAHKLAAESPADAERVLERVRGLDPNNAGRYVVAVCSRMARTDPTAPAGSPRRCSTPGRPGSSPTSSA